MNFKIEGIVVKQKSFLDEQKFLTILTANRGLIYARLKIGGQINRTVFSNVNVLGYYEFNIFEGSFGCVVDAVDSIELFFNLRFDPKKLALAQYFCELIVMLTPPTQVSKQHLKLILNSIWFLTHDKHYFKIIKSVFELRLISISGYRPNLVGCKFCNFYKKPNMFYILDQGCLICSDCLKTNLFEFKLKLTNDVLHAMRFIIYKEIDQIFNFKLNVNSLNYLNKITEKIVLNVLEIVPKSLKIYYQF